MKGFLVVGAVLLMGASMFGFAGCTAKNALPEKAAPGAQLEQPAAQAEEEDIVRELVKDFDYAFPAGFEEVEAILSSKPLTPLE